MEYDTDNKEILYEQIKELKEEIVELKREKIAMHKTLQEYGIENDISQVSDVEFICTTQIEVLKNAASNGELIKEQVENLERIVKVLNREWAGIKKKELKSHEKDVGKLLEIAQGNE